MHADDRERWDERYADGDWADIAEPTEVVSAALEWLEPPGVVLDAACGAGRNAMFLARRGFRVLGVDISFAGLRRLIGRAGPLGTRILAVNADLERLTLPEAAFDAIVNSYYLERSLFPAFRAALKPGGLLLFETYNMDEIDQLGGDIRRAYALERGELGRAFPDLESLYYEEGVFEQPDGERGLARLIARKPGPIRG